MKELMTVGAKYGLTADDVRDLANWMEHSIGSDKLPASWDWLYNFVTVKEVKNG